MAKVRVIKELFTEKGDRYSVGRPIPDGIIDEQANTTILSIEFKRDGLVGINNAIGANSSSYVVAIEAEAGEESKVFFDVVPFDQARRVRFAEEVKNNEEKVCETPDGELKK